VGDINLFRGEVAEKKAGRYLVKTELGELHVAAPDGVDYAGRQMAYGVRPEAVVLGKEAQQCENRFQVKPPHMFYFGNSMECVFEVKDGLTVRANIAPEHAVFPTAGDGVVTVGWHAKDAILIEKPSVIEGLNIDEVIYGK
jgi:hypothetical protein